MHTGESPNKCKYCGKIFTTKNWLKQHERVHTGEKPYECKFCGQRFAYACAYRVHKKRHNVETNFLYQYKCDTCGKEFIMKTELKLHELTHTGEKQYAYKNSTKKFVFPHGLKERERTHTRTYGCNNACDKTLASLIFLKDIKSIRTADIPCILLFQMYTCSLPTDLSLRPTRLSTGGYGVWSLKEIPIGTRFGPYEGAIVKSSKRGMKGNFQCNVNTTWKKMRIVGVNDENGSNWLRYVNCAPLNEQQNLIPIRLASGVYYITCQLIPANTELLVWYRDDMVIDYKACALNKIEVEEEMGRDNFQTDHYYSKNQNKEKCVHNLGDEVGCNGRHHKKTSEYSSICSFCKQIVSKEKTTKAHEGCHTNECNICGKSFTQRRSLIEHQRIHTGEKPYECKVCGKKFTHIGTFRRHRKTKHT